MLGKEGENAGFDLGARQAHDRIQRHTSELLVQLAVK